MTREEAIKLRDDNIKFQREAILDSEEYFEPEEVLEIIDEIIKDIRKCDKNIEALQERPKGRWIELPCAIGDTVYFIDSPIPAVVDGIRIVEDGIIVDWVQYDKSYELTEVWDYGGFDATDIGETVFFTAEEAEKALADMRESEQE